MTKWPSGPWRVDINQLGRHIRNNDRVIFTAPRVTYFEGQPERYENDLAAQHAALNLGAAAPDMYAALKMVSALQAAHPEVLAVVDAAMRKARGE